MLSIAVKPLLKFIFVLHCNETRELDRWFQRKELHSVAKEDVPFNHSCDLLRGEEAAELLREFLGALELKEQGVQADICSREKAFETFLGDDEFSALFTQDQVELDNLLGETIL